MGYGELMKFAEICVAEINLLHQGCLAGLKSLNLSLFIVNKFYPTNPPHVFHVDTTWKRSLRLKCVTICRAKCLDMVTLKVLPTSRFRYNSDVKSTIFPNAKMKLNKIDMSFPVQVL